MLDLPQMSVAPSKPVVQAAFPPEPAGLHREEIESIAARIASALHFEPWGDLDSVVGKLGGNVHYIPENDWLAENSERIDVNGPGDFDVFLPQSSGMISRFALAHELGHYFLHSRMGEKRISANFTPHSEDRRHPLAEWEATTFAAALLLPEDQFREAIDGADSDFELASRFRVSEIAVKKRKEVLGIPSGYTYSAPADTLSEC